MTVNEILALRKQGKIEEAYIKANDRSPSPGKILKQDQSQTRLDYGMARKGRIKFNQSLSWDYIIIVTLLVHQVHL